jgi:hypothetical protein
MVLVMDAAPSYHERSVRPTRVLVVILLMIVGKRREKAVDFIKEFGAG